METLAHNRSYASQRSVAMALALVTAIVLSPLYLAGRNRDERKWYYENRWTPSSSGFVLPAVIAGLVIAIRTTASSSSSSTSSRSSSAPDPTRLLRVGGSSWGLAGVLVMLLVVITWQDSVQELFWR